MLIITFSFTPSAIQDYSHLLQNRLTTLISSLRDAISKNPRQDIGDWFGYFAFDFMGDMAFGGLFDLTSSGRDQDGFCGMIRSTMNFRGLISHIPELCKTLCL
jgi:hypothetical protein